MTAREPSTNAKALAGPAGRTSGESVAPSVALPWVVQLRFLLAAGEAALLFFGSDAANLRTLWSFCGPAIGIQVASNIWLAQFARRRHGGSEHVLGAVFGLDAVVLTIVFAFSGGPTNPYTLLYLVQITLSAVILHKTWTWALGALSTICYGLLFLLSTAASSHAGHEISETMARHVTGMWFAFALAAGALTFFIGQVSETLQKRQREVLELQGQVARQERLASLVTLAGGAAHEMGTPLGTIAIAAREIERGAEGQPCAAALGEDARLIRAQVDRCRAILSDMSAKGAEPLGEALAKVRLGELFKSVADSLPPSSSGRLDADFASTQEIWTYPASVTQALTALVKNGLDASPNGDPVRLEAEVDDASVTFSVCDCGEGMDPETLAHVSDPFFTRKAQGEGMGLGAFLVHLFATRVGGELRYDTAVGEGTTAYLRLPVSRRCA